MMDGDFLDMLLAAYPRAIDITCGEFQQTLNAEQLAKEAGYRIAGIRLGRVVFTTKPKEPDALADKRDTP